jgi:DNA-binding NarL/FixJ family response regulator
MIRVLLVSEEPALAAGFSSVLAGAEDFQLFSVCASLAEAKLILRRDTTQLGLVDLTAETRCALVGELDRELLTRKIILWVRDIPTEMALFAMSAGVRGILRSTLGPELLLRCLRKVAAGELWFEKALVDSFLAGRRTVLTRREAQLVEWLSLGLKNREIAAKMSISEGTVKVYLSRIFQKVGVKDRFALARYGMQNRASGLGPLRPRRRPPLVRVAVDAGNPA